MTVLDKDVQLLKELLYNPYIFNLQIKEHLQETFKHTVIDLYVKLVTDPVLIGYGEFAPIYGWDIIAEELDCMLNSDINYFKSHANCFNSGLNILELIDNVELNVENAGYVYKFIDIIIDDVYNHFKDLLIIVENDFKTVIINILNDELYSLYNLLDYGMYIYS